MNKTRGPWIILEDTTLEAPHVIGWSTADMPATPVMTETYALAVVLDTAPQPLVLVYADKETRDKDVTTISRIFLDPLYDPKEIN